MDVTIQFFKNAIVSPAIALNSEGKIFWEYGDDRRIEYSVFDLMHYSWFSDRQLLVLQLLKSVPKQVILPVKLF